MRVLFWCVAGLGAVTRMPGSACGATSKLSGGKARPTTGPHAQHKNDFAVVMESLSEMEAAVEGLRQGAEKMVESKIAATLLSRNSDASQSRQSKLGKYPGGAPVPRQAKVNAIAAAKFSKG